MNHRWQAAAVVALVLVIGSGTPLALATQEPSVGNEVVLAGTPTTSPTFAFTLEPSEGSTSELLRLDLLVTNTSGAETQVPAPLPVIEVYDRGSRAWPTVSAIAPDTSATVPAGDSFRIELSATNPNILRYSGPVFVRVRHQPDQQPMVFAVWFDDGTVSVPETLPVNPLNAGQQPIGAPALAQQLAAQTVEADAGLPDDAPIDIDALIPPLEAFPPGMWIANQGKLGQTEITSTFDDPAMTDLFLNNWGWQENAFIYLEGAPTSDGISYIDIGIHRFRDANGAMLATDYYATSRAEIMGMWTIEDPNLGDRSQAITNGEETSVYMVIDAVVVRVSVAGTNPTPQALDTAQSILSRVTDPGT